MRDSVVRDNEFRLGALAWAQSSPVNIPEVSDSLCVSPSLSLSASHHKPRGLPPHWLERHDVTSHLIGRDAAEGRRGGRGREEREMKENAGTCMGGGVLLQFFFYYS